MCVDANLRVKSVGIKCPILFKPSAIRSNVLEAVYSLLIRCIRAERFESDQVKHWAHYRPVQNRSYLIPIIKR